jgi:hypothetical protein
VTHSDTPLVELPDPSFVQPSAADVDAFLQFGSVIRTEFRWIKTGPFWKAQANLEDTYEGARVRLIGTYNPLTGNLSFALIWAGCRVRGLDRHGPPHPNPDGQLLQCPHKHRWTDADRDQWAYHPADITASDREGVFRQFLAESNIRFEGTYLEAYDQGSLL